MNRDEVTKIGYYSHGLMLLTSIHHVYGAVVYHTSWRLHVLLMSVPMIVITELIRRLLVKRNNPFPRFFFWIYWTLILLVSIILFGTFEGLYNHFIKNLLYYGGANDEILFSLFPPPAYVMPDDFGFELTGVLQAAILIPLVIYFLRLTKKIFSHQPSTI